MMQAVSCIDEEKEYGKIGGSMLCKCGIKKKQLPSLGSGDKAHHLDLMFWWEKDKKEILPY